MTVSELIEYQREEIKALKAANLDLQIHFDTMKAELGRAFITAESCDGIYRVVIQSETLKEMHALYDRLIRINTSPAKQVKIK